MYDVVEIHVHEKWSREKENNDIALLKLENNIRLNKNISLIELASEETPPFAEVTAAGWGDSVKENTPTNDLQFVTMNTISIQDCSDAFPTHLIYDTQICTQTSDGSGTCVGDSGAPLVFENKVVGVLSWGTVCGGGQPEVYTKVQSYVNWINSKINHK